MTRQEELHEAYTAIEKHYGHDIPEFARATAAVLDLIISYDPPTMTLYVSGIRPPSRIHRFSVASLGGLRGLTDEKWAALLGKVKDGMLPGGQSFDVKNSF